MYIRFFFLFGLIFLISFGLNAQSIFHRTYGGVSSSPYAEGRSLIQTADGGYAILGESNVNGVNNLEGYLVKTDNKGAIQWTKTYGGNYMQLWSIDTMRDKGFIISGMNTFNSSGAYRPFVARTNSIGDTLWTRMYGDSVIVPGSFMVHRIRNDEIIISGSIYVGYGDPDILLIKINDTGKILWLKIIRRTGYEVPHDLKTTKDGGFIICGDANGESFLLKTDSLGNVEWANSYGDADVGTGIETGNSVSQTSDGGYLITGTTSGFVTLTNDSYNMYVVKTDNSGNLLWSKTCGGISFEYGYSGIESSKGNLVVVGTTFSGPLSGREKLYVIRFDSAGNELQSLSFGNGPDLDEAFSVIQTRDRGFAFAGYKQKYSSNYRYMYFVKADSLLHSGCDEIDTFGQTVVTDAATIVQSIILRDTIISLPNHIPSIILGSGGTSSIICLTTDVKLNTSNQENFSLYPNPFSESATIELPAEIYKNANIKIEIYDIYGRSIRKADIEDDNYELKRNGLADGIYFYKIQSENKLIGSGKFVISQ